MTKNMFSSVMAFIVEAGIMTKSQTGLISAVFWLVYGIFQVLGGFAVDKFSPYKMVLIGIVSGIAANMVIYFNQSYGVVMSWGICGIVIIVIAVLLHKKWTLFINNTGGK